MAQATSHMPPAPASRAAIDRDHLGRMTFGNASLARELLELFDRQAVLLLARLQTVEAGAVAALAHTLKGSALGIGAQGVAEAAATVERAPDAAALRAALIQLSAQIEAAQTDIAAMLEADSAAGR